ncbi:MAG TPA: cysteine rich repeat-containing protein [Anaeromyxobacteraceae bacterium]|nr:cysteine rich repeat-containing protein [Anaeromyxobacteraceae bacterium]
MAGNSTRRFALARRARLAAGSPWTGQPVAASLLAAAGLALAALPGVPRAENPCAGDVKRFCANVELGGGRLGKCMDENKERLSPACQARMAADEAWAQALLKEFGQSCMHDVDRYCASVRAGEGRVMACLARHQDDLTHACQEGVERYEVARERVRTVRDACRADVKKFCESQTVLAGALVECLEEHQTELSAECLASGPAMAAKAARALDVINRLTSQERIQETLEVLQGLNSVAFSRSQFAFQIDAIQGLGGQGNADRLTFNPQFVFGDRNDFAFIVQVPVLAVYPYTTAVPTTTGLGDILTAFAWAFSMQGGIRQYAAIVLQWDTGTSGLLGAAWAVQPTYAIALGLARWLSLTTEVAWIQSFGNRGSYRSYEVLSLRPIFVVALPLLAFTALDTTLAWNFANGAFVPVMKLSLGKFIDRNRALSISAWYQATLTSAAVSQSFKFDVGVGLSYFFDW